ncbi:MAG TPA: 50S ribosomal protein L27, partial [Candidatus Nitrosocosmicus sp.]|nr:50S ribosomal protein L27 [Candidatus Nitrosocosmicus sp.]
MAHTKAQKAAKGNKDSVGRRLGVKIYGDQCVSLGNVIVKQRGMEFKPGEGTKAGKDYTIYALRSGKVSFKKKNGDRYIVVNE